MLMLTGFQYLLRIPILRPAIPNPPPHTGTGHLHPSALNPTIGTGHPHSLAHTGAGRSAPLKAECILFLQQPSF